MKIKIKLLIIFLSLYACIDTYDIEPKAEFIHDSYGNLGFEEGLIHWYGEANTFSSIAIETDAYEGDNALKMSISTDTTSSDLALAEISKLLNVMQGDTVELSFQIRFSSDDTIAGVNLYNIGIFNDTNGTIVESIQDSINQISTEWQMINIKYPVPQDAEKLLFGVRIVGSNEDAYVIVDDFLVTIKPLFNQSPSDFLLLSPSNSSSLPSSEEIELKWELANDINGDYVTYDIQIWTDAVIGNYLSNSGFDEVVTHWLGDEIPSKWDFWPYYYHNVFSYPQLGDSIFNAGYVRSGAHSMWITGDFTGQSNKTILYQSFFADYIPPGTMVTFSGYMLNPSIDPIKNNNQGYISIDQFANPGTSINNSSWIINHSSESITSSHDLDTWNYFEVSSITEETTNYLQIRINYEQFDDDSGTVFIDDLMITTSNTKLILFEQNNIDTTNLSIEKTILTEPYDFSERESLTYYWNIIARDDFSSNPSDNGPFELIKE